MKRFRDDIVSAPFKNPNFDPGWFVSVFPDVGQETIYGPYRTRQRARKAQRALKQRASGSGAWTELFF